MIEPNPYESPAEFQSRTALDLPNKTRGRSCLLFLGKTFLMFFLLQVLAVVMYTVFHSGNSGPRIFDETATKLTPSVEAIAEESETEENSEVKEEPVDE